MDKQGQFRRRDRVVPRNHPDGGTAHIKPLDIVTAVRLQDALRDVKYEHDAETGAIVIDDDGQPVKRAFITDSELVTEKVRVIRETCVTAVTNVVDADEPLTEEGQPNFLEMSPDMIEAWLAQTSVREVEAVLPVMRWDAEKGEHVAALDGEGQPVTETRMVEANEPYFQWALNEAAKLGRVGAAAEKNSVSTPSESSVQPAP